MKKWLCILLSVITIIFVPSFAFADTEGTGESPVTVDAVTVENPVVLDFRYYSYTLNNLSADDVVVTKVTDNAERIEYEVYDKDEPTVVDTIRVDFDTVDVSTLSTKESNTRSTFFYRYKTVKNTRQNKTIVKLQYRVRVDLYESGSFRGFYGADSSNLLIQDGSVTSFELLDKVTGIKSATGKYPTTSLTYNYSANLRTTTTLSATSSIGITLQGAGFTASSGVSQNSYYYRIVADTGTIDLY